MAKATVSEKSAQIMRARDLASLSGAMFDVPPRIRRFLTVAGVLGIIIVVVESLVGNQLATLQTDKVLHFLGYAVLACVFTLGLQPRHYQPMLALLFVVGLLIEFLQPLNMRDMDMADQYANTLGIVCGALLGLIIRSVYAHLRQDLAEKEVRRKLVRFEPGEVIIAEGEPIRRFAVLRRGKVRLSQRENGRTHTIGELGPGEVIGTVGVIQGTPQVFTATAIEACSVYALDLDDVLESAGGRDAPVSLILRTMASYLRRLSDDKLALQRRLETPAQP